MSDFTKLFPAGGRTLFEIRRQNFNATARPINSGAPGMRTRRHRYCPADVHYAAVGKADVPHILRRPENDTSALRGHV